MRHLFRIPIGDWSGDGHGKCKWFNASAAKQIKDVREAFFKAKKSHPEVDPESFYSQYMDSELPDEVTERLISAGYTRVDELSKCYLKEMAEVVVWFCNLGDWDLQARLEPDDAVPILPFYGYDEKKRHIGFFGYGLMGE